MESVSINICSSQNEAAQAAGRLAQLKFRIVVNGQANTATANLPAGSPKVGPFADLWVVVGVKP